MAVEDLGQKNHEIGPDSYLGFSAPTRAPDRVESQGIRGGSATMYFDRQGLPPPGWTFSTGC